MRHANEKTRADRYGEQTSGTCAGTKRDRFDQVVDVGRSLSQDRKRTAKAVAKPGYGDKGDRTRRAK